MRKLSSFLMPLAAVGVLAATAAAVASPASADPYDHGWSRGGYEHYDRDRGDYGRREYRDYRPAYSYGYAYGYRAYRPAYGYGYGYDRDHYRYDRDRHDGWGYRYERR